MQRSPDLSDRTAISAAFAWWQLAGVDAHYADGPRDWLAPPAAPPGTPQPAAPTAAPPAPVPPRAQIGGNRAAWPDTLDAWRGWWLAEPTLDDGRVAGRVASRGAAGAELLVLVPQSEAHDADAGRLLAGPQGALVANMLRAMGLAPERTAIAALLPRHTPFADWAGLGQAGLSAITAHHLALLAPQRVLALGAGILPLLGHDPAQKTAALTLVNQQAPTVPLMAGPDPQVLLDRPATRAALWRDWLDWTKQA